MNMKLKMAAMMAAALFVVTTQSQALVSLSTVSGGYIFESDGVTLANGIATYLIDKDGDGFGDLTLPTTFIPDLDDSMIGKIEIVDGFINGALPDFALGGGIDIGDNILLVFYPGLTMSATQPGYSQPFGTFRTDSIPAFSDINFKVPSDGIYALNHYTLDAGGDLANNAMVANQVTQAIPEPSSIALVVLGLVGVIAGRKFKRS
jgi:hypothetical protein